MNEYIVIKWPAILELMGLPGFGENSYLVDNDKEGLESIEYFVNKDWLLDVQYDFIDL